MQYLGAKVSNLPGVAVDSLYSSAIVPVLDAKSKTLALKAPKDVYLADVNREGLTKGYKSLCVCTDSARCNFPAIADPILPMAPQLHLCRLWVRRQHLPAVAGRQGRALAGRCRCAASV
jgi:hypothetical protein